MQNRILIDSELPLVFKNHIEQPDNYNRNSEIFVNGSEVYKIYNNQEAMYHYNIKVVKELLKRKRLLSSIPELVLPNELLIYNQDIVGFTMPYIKGLTLDSIINNNLFSDEEIKVIFKKVLFLINKLKTLPFKIMLGDLHEKNVIIDASGDIHIIDCDSYIIDGNKLVVDNTTLIGRYPNCYYQEAELKKVDISADYLSLFSMIINYVFKGIVSEINPITFIKEHEEFHELEYIIDRLNKENEFYLTSKDIDHIFSLKDKIIVKEEEIDLEKELKRVRKIVLKSKESERFK